MPPTFQEPVRAIPSPPPRRRRRQPMPRDRELSRTRGHIANEPKAASFTRRTDRRPANTVPTIGSGSRGASTAGSVRRVELESGPVPLYPGFGRTPLEAPHKSTLGGRMADKRSRKKKETATRSLDDATLAKIKGKKRERRPSPICSTLRDSQESYRPVDLAAAGLQTDAGPRKSASKPLPPHAVIVSKTKFESHKPYDIVNSNSAFV